MSPWSGYARIGPAGGLSASSNAPSTYGLVMYASDVNQRSADKPVALADEA